jgi:Holliday junction DNA helicase RuvA
MIGFLRGKLLQKHPPALLVDVGGVGYELEAPMSTFYSLPAIGAEVKLHTHLVVREDAQLLYGFATEAERRLFRDLLRVSGVGPKIGLALLSGMSVEAFLLCVEAQDVESLVRVPGIGRKTAERLLIEMRDRIRALGEGAAMPGVVGAALGAGGAMAEAFAAMVALGYRPAEVTRLLKSVQTDGAATEDIIREALKLAAGK